MYARFAPAAQVAAAHGGLPAPLPAALHADLAAVPGRGRGAGDAAARGFRLAVATTKRSDMAHRFVAAMGLTAALDHVQGTDDFPHKPAPDVIERALAALGADGVWMVGDTVHDVEAGRAAGLATYALTWGTHDAARLRAARPDRLEDSLDALLDATGRVASPWTTTASST
jgi:phosphoglycolate phosphatase